MRALSSKISSSAGRFRVPATACVKLSAINVSRIILVSYSKSDVQEQTRLSQCLRFQVVSSCIASSTTLNFL